MVRERNKDIESDFYDTVKAIWGSKGIVATHPTWFPYPNWREFKKNGLDWWVAKRDWAQTDEITPFCVRTALAKKWDSAVWYNMYYSRDLKDYQSALWSSVLGGGRINYHPLYPTSDSKTNWSMENLLRGNLMRGESRVRLLNFISKSPLDCSVAVIFGHTSAMNWAGKNYDDVGLDLAEKFWQNGYPADLIPSTEIKSSQLNISSDNYIQYGPQKYQAVVLYHPEYEDLKFAEFFKKCGKCKTSLYRIGDWTRDFNGNAIDVTRVLPERMLAFSDSNLCMNSVIECLRFQGVSAQMLCTERMVFWDHFEAIRPSSSGHCRLIDGTEIFTAGTNSVAGDPINIKFKISGFEISAKAVGVLGVRLGNKGQLNALAAGGLTSFHGGNMDIELKEPVDVALWSNNHGGIAGVVQGVKGEIPEVLTAITKDWRRVGIPEQLRN
jgi:hypothetical protein